MCTKIIDTDSEVMRSFEKVRAGFSLSTQHFVNYLIKVRGDYAGAESVLDHQRLRERQLIDSDIGQKMYLRLKLNN